MIRFIMIVLLAMTTPSPIEAKTKTAPTKTAQTRIDEVFGTRKPPTRKPQPVRLSEKQLQQLLDEWVPYQVLGLRQPPQYIADRPAIYINGKLMLYRECEVDVKQDPGESSCRVVWAWI